MMLVTEYKLLGIFLNYQPKSQRVGQDAILLKADVGMPALLLDNRIWGQQDSIAIRRANQFGERRIVDGADNNWLLSFARQERPKVVYIHMASQPADIDHSFGACESKTSEDQHSEKETACRLGAVLGVP